MNWSLIVMILAVVFGVAYFAKRNHRKSQELKRQTRRHSA